MPGRRHSLCAMIVSQAPQAYGGAGTSARFAASIVNDIRRHRLARGRVREAAVSRRI
jgi:hypothetical protein